MTPPIGPPLSGKPPRPLRVVLYARVSTYDRGQDVESQLAALRPWAAARGWLVVAEESDRVTGDPMRRHGDPPGLRRALRPLELRQAEVLAVFSADRLVRSPTALLALVARVQSLGAHVASYQDGADLDTTTDVGELLVFIRGWFARMQLRLTRAGTVAGLARARAAGRRLGRPRVSLDVEPARLVELRARGWTWRRLANKYAGGSVGTIRRRHAEALQGGHDGQ